MKNKVNKKVSRFIIGSMAFASLFFATEAFAATFGNTNAGASSTETAQLYYTGKVWFYPQRTGVKQGSLKYTRSGKTVASAKTGYLPYPYGWDKNNRQAASTGVWDSLSWNGPKTIFTYSLTK